MGRRADVPHAVILALLAAAPGSACAGPAVPEEAPMISSSQDPQLRLYEGRLRRTGVPLEMASVPLAAVSLGATASSAVVGPPARPPPFAASPPHDALENRHMTNNGATPT